MPHPVSDSQLDAEVVARVLAGDVEAFAVLVDRYQDGFAQYAAQMTGSADDAADIIQESFVRGFRFLRHCDNPANVKGWLFRIVSNQCKTHLSRRGRRKTVPLENGAALPAPEDPARDVMVSDLQKHVHRAMQELPPDQREALVLKYVQDRSLAEMAELLDASVPALKMRLLRARTALREKLQGLVS